MAPGVLPLLRRLFVLDGVRLDGETAGVGRGDEPEHDGGGGHLVRHGLKQWVRVSILAQSYETFYICNLRIFIIRSNVC